MDNILCKLIFCNVVVILSACASAKASSSTIQKPNRGGGDDKKNKKERVLCILKSMDESTLVISGAIVAITVRISIE